MLDAVIDGTPCFEGNSYRDVCINGMCKVLGMFPYLEPSWDFRFADLQKWVRQITALYTGASLYVSGGQRFGGQVIIWEVDDKAIWWGGE